jgi:NADH-quinone oxidoreductase subunit E
MNVEIEAEIFDKVGKIAEEYKNNPNAIIAILQSIQEHYRYLPREAFTCLAARLNVSRSRIYSVATFYENFSLLPKGRYVLKVCNGTACHVRKSIPIWERLRRELGLLEDKNTTGDLLFTVETVSCLGACGLAPVMTVNDKVYPAMTPEKASVLLETLKEEGKNALQ